jgi:tetratricopeptide (TPR) repeat protein
LRRWLNKEPITARPATRCYRLKKFTQRNKPLVIGIVLAALAMAAGTIVATNQAVQARRAERLASTRAANARVLAASVLEKLQNAIASLPQTTAMRADLIRESIRFLDDVSNEFAGDADILLIAARAHTQLGRAVGSVRGASMNDVPASITEYERAIETLAAAHRLEPKRADITREEAYARMALTDAYREQGRTQQAIGEGLRSAAGFQSIIHDNRATVDALECVGMYRLSAEIARDND